MLKVNYRVHNPHMSPAAHRANIKGHEVAASVDTLEVELVAQDTSNGTIKLRFIGSDVEAAKALFAKDAAITATFEAAAPAAKAKAA